MHYQKVAVIQSNRILFFIRSITDKSAVSFWRSGEQNAHAILVLLHVKFELDLPEP